MAKRLTTQEFVKRARGIHGNRYDYSRVVYVDARSKIQIGCSDHGFFDQSPSKHLSGQNCPSCAGNKKRTTEDFVVDARKVHGDRYGYSRVVYTDAHSRVTITCPEHGDFDQIADGHLVGQGCPRCAGVATRTLEEFITEARSVHGDRYDYSIANYSNNKTPVKIICRAHGVFQQSPDGHLAGKEGCQDCYQEATGSIKPLSRESFIDKARRVHGQRYDYSPVKYRGTHQKVTIVCPDHGPFRQRAGNHVSGIGCPACGREGLADSLRMTVDEFLRRARDVHGDKYDYENVDYKGRDISVSINCPEHGVFQQTPRVHMRGNGCSKCGKEKLADAFRLGVDEFIRRANALYGDKFDYSNVEYVNKDTPIAVICPEHGPFETTPGNHLTSKTGCGQCAGNVRLTISGFVEKAVEVHGDFYDYSNVDYLNTKSDVEIICPEHGPFQQTPGGHLSGRGCLLCANARKPGLYQIEKALAGRYDNLQGYLYVIHAISPRGVECWKVGVGQGTRLVGIRAIMKQAGFNVLSWDRFEMPTMGAAVIVEDAIHKRLSDNRFFPGVHFGGWHELFTRKPHVRRFMRGARYLNYIAGLD